MDVGTQLRDLEAKNLQLEEIQSQHSALLSNRNEEIERLSFLLKEVKTAAQKNKQSLESELLRVSKEKEALVSAVKRAQAEVQNSASRNGELRKDVTLQSARLSALGEQIQVLSKENSQLKDQFEPLMAKTQNQTKELVKEVERLRAENQKLQAGWKKLREELAKKTLELDQLKAVRAREESGAYCPPLSDFTGDSTALQQLQQENQRLRKAYPVRDLLKVKEQKISNAQSYVKAIPPGHPARDEAAKILKDMTDQRDLLQSLSQEFEGLDDVFSLQIGDLESCQNLTEC